MASSWAIHKSNLRKGGYKVIRQTDHTVLMEQILRYIDDGWTTVGPMQVIWDPKTSTLQHYQTLVQYAPKDEGDDEESC